VNIFAGRADWLASAIHAEPHEQVRRVLDLNAWKIKNWSDYASWKKHGQRWVSIAWRNKCRLAVADAGFVEIQEA
jgi:hypothetical protein